MLQWFDTMFFASSSYSKMSKIKHTQYTHILIIAISNEHNIETLYIAFNIAYRKMMQIENGMKRLNQLKMILAFSIKLLWRQFCWQCFQWEVHLSSFLLHIYFFPLLILCWWWLVLLLTPPLLLLILNHFPHQIEPGSSYICYVFFSHIHAKNIPNFTMAIGMILMYRILFFISVLSYVG